MKYVTYSVVSPCFQFMLGKMEKHFFLENFRPNGEQYLNLLDFEQDYQAARLGRLGWKVKQRTQHEHYDELADYVVKFDQL